MRARWFVEGSPLDFDFSRAQYNLRSIGDSDVNGVEIPQEWISLYLFGEQSYAEGGGAASFIGLHAETGQVFGLDVERESSSLFLLNSDVDKFISTFDIFDRALRLKTLRVEQVAQFAESIDPVAFAVSEWRDLAAAIVSDEDFEEGQAR